MCGEKEKRLKKPPKKTAVNFGKLTAVSKWHALPEKLNACYRGLPMLLVFGYKG